MDQEFNLGDLVQLKSGGPAMTVVEFNGYDYICRWFTASRNEIIELLHPATLKRAEEAPSLAQYGPQITFKFV
jgi:uncharacterized protein YodC (DUF2158 family)